MVVHKSNAIPPDTLPPSIALSQPKLIEPSFNATSAPTQYSSHVSPMLVEFTLN